MDLKSGALFWPQLPHPHVQPRPLPEHLRCDVAVIGAGLSGSLIAHALSREGLDVVILDKRGPGRGSTSASTALVLYEIDTPLVQLARQRGTRAAVRSYQRCRQAIDELATLVRQLRDPCGFRRRPSLYLASQPAHLDPLRKEFAARQRAGFDVSFLGPTEVAKRFSFTAPGAIFSEEAGEINPFALTNRLIERAVEHGARVFAPVEALDVTATRQRMTIHVAGGGRIQAGWVVVATGFETAARAARRVVKLKSSYALVSQPVTAFPGWHRRCLIWETQRPYLYLRTTPDNRIMVGGEDEEFLDARKRDRLMKKKCAILNQKVQQLFPAIQTRPAYAWAGTFGETKDGLPYIGCLRAGSRIFYALCYGANGTNFAVIAADIIRNAILQRPNPHAALFAFDR